MVDPQLVDGDDTAPWIFDTGPLSHFAKAGWLGLLKLIAGNHPVIIPDVVYDEIFSGSARHPHLNLVLDATSTWITVRQITETEGLVAFANYSSLLVGADGVSNLGECGVLALAETLPGTAILDDRTARQAAMSQKVVHRGSVAIILDAILHHGLSREAAGAVADDILATAYRFPFESGRFISWAIEHGYLDYE